MDTNSSVLILGYDFSLSEQMKIYLDLASNYINREGIGNIFCSSSYKQVLPRLDGEYLIKGYLKNKGLVGLRYQVEQITFFDFTEKFKIFKELKKTLGEKTLKPGRLAIFCQRGDGWQVKLLSLIFLKIRPKVIAFDFGI